ncbi:MAG: tRNA (cytidine(34)-2'-O)-methyltransferase, partial [Planctomycetota bacterium]
RINRQRSSRTLYQTLIVSNRRLGHNVTVMSMNTGVNIVLHQPEIPHNTGNIGRTCVATGSKLWIVRPCGFRLDDHHLRRAGLDYWQHLDWEISDSWSDLQAALPEKRFWYFSRHATRSFYDVDFQPQDVLVFGSETQGLPASICDHDNEHSLRIPTTGLVRSLNLSNSVAIAIYEAARQIGAERLGG